MRRIAVLGVGYVGLVTATCFAELGNEVSCYDTDLEKIERLRRGSIPFFEPGLAEMVLRNQQGGRLRFEVSFGDAVRDSEVVFIAVGTPMAADGHADLSSVRSAAHEIATHLDCEKLVVNKSTVPVETGDLVSAIIREHNTSAYDVHVVSNPEFLREGSAIADFMQPDRIVIGASDGGAVELMRELYAPLNAAIVVTDVRTAEMIKYTANAFLATKISFINEIANICDSVGADIKDVVAGAGSDHRIGTAFMNAGLGFGGSCFPKDVTALARMADASGVAPLILSSVLEVNRLQIPKIADRLDAAIGGLAGQRVAVLGLSFKPNTDDVRESPAVAFVEEVLRRGGQVCAHDPVAIAGAAALLGDRISYVHSAYEAVHDADATVVATDWNEYKQLDFAILKKLMRGPVIVDARNIYKPAWVESFGFVYIGVGHGSTTTKIPRAAGSRRVRS